MIGKFNAKIDSEYKNDETDAKSDDLPQVIAEGSCHTAKFRSKAIGICRGKS